MESRQQFGVGQEIIEADLDKIPSRVERGMFDYIIREMLGRKTDAFFQDSFNVIFVDDSSVLLKSGVGFQNIVTDSHDPDNKPLYLGADKTLNFNAPNAANNRIDAIAVKYSLIDGETVSRRYKDITTQEVSDRNFVISKIWSVETLVVEGEAAVEPVCPDIPAGYLKITEVLVSAALGIVDQDSISDLRTLLPISTQYSTVGSYEYDAVVGSIPQANYETLGAALIAAQDGWKILVLESDTIEAGEIPTVTKDNIEINFKRDVTFTKGSAAIGLIVQGDFFKIKNGRFKDFSSGGNFGVHLDGSNFAEITGIRYLNCDSNFSDEGTNTVHVYSIEE